VAFGLGDLALFLYPLVTDQIWPATAIIALVGLPGAALFAGAMTIFQLGTDDRVRGRVFGALTTVQNLAMLGCTFLAGALAQRLGVLPVITVQGVVYLLAGVLVLLALRPTAAGATTPDPGAEPAEVLDNPAVTTMLPSMPLASNVRTRTVSDPLAMRALAHPIRVELQGLVAREGTLTAADAARQLGISHALASHHLRQLAKYGFIEPADSPDNRAHPWRVTSTSHQFDPADPGARTSLDVLDRHVVERAGHQLAEWQQRRSGEDPAWAEVGGARSGLLYLTPEELTEVLAAWNRIIAPLAARRPVGHPDQRPDDAVPVSVTRVAVPLPRTEQGG
jgi:hypothetical protein